MVGLIQSLLMFSLSGVPLLALSALILAAVAKKWYGFFRMLAALFCGVGWGIVGMLVTTVLFGKWDTYCLWCFFWGAWLLSSLGFPAVLALRGFKQHQLIWAWAGICGTASLFLLWISLGFMIYLGVGA